MTEIQKAPNHPLIASDRIEGTVVRRHNGEKIGKIERLMIDKVSGTIAYAVMSFGGLFGLGDSHYAIPWSLLKYNRSLDAYESDIPDEQLATQSFENIDFGNLADEEALHRHYGVGPYWGSM